MILVVRTPGVVIIERVMVINRAIVTVNLVERRWRFAQVARESDLVLGVDVDRFKIAWNPDLRHVLCRAEHAIIDELLRLSAA